MLLPTPIWYALLLFQLGHTLEITTWNDDRCIGNNGPIRNNTLGPSNGCNTRSANYMDANTGSTKRQSEDQPEDLPGDLGNPGVLEMAVVAQPVEGIEEDDSQYIVFFTSEDCEPSTMINISDAGCSTDLGGDIGEYKSWEIWDMCNGTIGCTLEDGS